MTTKLNLTELPPLSLYIHIPWCVRKCPYCDFNSHTTNRIPEDAYVKALIADLDQELALIQDRSLQSIFFGGGTPSLFSANSIASILNQVEARIPFLSDIEITLEANPGTVEQKQFAGFFAAGVNRLSIGVQSFNPKHLSQLGRIHNREEAITAINTARRSGFQNFNLDLMHGLPQQTETDAMEDLQRALELNPSHLSWYQLTIEPNTAFYSAPPVLPDDDRLADIQAAGENLLAQAGFQQYEVSAYSKDQPSRHNLNYWQFGDFLGIGAGAHGKITQLVDQCITRRWKTRVPKDYLERDDRVAGIKSLKTEELPLEFMMNNLRLNDGFRREGFKQRTGLPFSAIQEPIQALIEKGLLSEKAGKVATTQLGQRFLNSVLEEF